MTNTSATTAPPRTVERLLAASITAACEALFPVNDFGAPDWRTTQMVARMLEYLQELPPPQRRLLTSLFLLVESMPLVTPPGGQRFSKLPPEQRAELVRGWRLSRFNALRVIGDALKATTTVIYMSHPLALEYVGAYTGCGRAASNPVAHAHGLHPGTGAS